MKVPAAVDSPRWSGRAWIAPGMAIFIGRAGHQDWHHHQAHQIALGVNALVSVESPQGCHTGAAVRIPAGVRHRLSGDIVMSIYLDVLSDEARALPEGRTLAPLEIATADVTRLIDALDETTLGVRRAVRRALGVIDLPTTDPRLAVVSAAVHSGSVRRDQLAALVHLSPTRFSHWFVEQTGLPLRSYAKWLRLTHAVQLLASGLSMTDAAHAVGFSDSAHFSRTFRALLGIDPSSALAEVRLQEG
ncbi:helix-turn-helix transcriptional regulator [Pseudomonas carnis]|uniref:Arac family transcriptional regulator n=2 Tax=Pseudomonas TaxID=286 RepID=A0AAX3ID69_9PSED|nr:AraC family transcriptional regulator [Pseudomonas coronafaciens]KRP57672.1 AraC family transcriptional regulator [Pseudomonas synxantha]MBA1256541.1 helix-turn-helix transcriptional regulator [Pseudomonas carnis]OOV94309.1 AraC family transcriptional regulator [Pseudomonas sp. MF6394]RMU97083.1 hypothetical protein ALP20_200135 [Pseudomonas coronafaciens pv. coronafaciens]TPV57016.1 helix-turn-helix transcriptional regulator [Pseudomonas fluorescens]HCF6376354.1 helix-turn-helix domain-co